jgi:hypothetical protein
LHSVNAIRLAAVKGTSYWSAIAIAHMLRTQVLRKSARTLESVAVKSWEIAPAEPSVAPRAFFLPGQLERVTGWAFTDEHPREVMEGGAGTHGATCAFLLRDVWLIDGTLYKEDARAWLAPRSGWHRQFSVEQEIDRGAIYSTARGIQYFGQWLLADCVTYPLARAEGLPVTTAQPVSAHLLAYESCYGMVPHRTRGAFIRELVIFDDLGQNRNKHLRARTMREQLLAGVDARPHPGVFILRGRAGELRLLSNELELAEQLRVQRGYRVIDPMVMDLPAIIAACAGAKVVIGVEGSQLMHGIAALGPGGTLVTLQPPNRFCPNYKHLTDRDHQHFAFVVGQTQGESFFIDPDEMERTLDLLPP